MVGKWKEGELTEGSVATNGFEKGLAPTETFDSWKQECEKNESSQWIDRIAFTFANEFLNNI